MLVASGCTDLCLCEPNRILWNFVVLNPPAGPREPQIGNRCDTTAIGEITGYAQAVRGESRQTSQRKLTTFDVRDSWKVIVTAFMVTSRTDGINRVKGSSILSLIGRRM